MADNRSLIERFEDRLFRIPKMTRLILAAIFWPVAIVYGLYYLWSRDMYTFSVRLGLTVVAVVFLLSVVLADFVPDREQSGQPGRPPAEQPR